jgi:hypothetical protein
MRLGNLIETHAHAGQFKGAVSFYSLNAALLAKRGFP